MNREETLALYEQGVEAWNKWANEMLEERKKLEEAGEWHDEPGFKGKLYPKNSQTQSWLENVKADFSTNETPHTFENEVEFQFFVFPGEVCFKNATFKKDAFFNHAIFGRDVFFNNVIFKGDTIFSFATFKWASWFNSANFNASTIFYETLFNNIADFNDTTFHNSLIFTLTKFKKEARFNKTTFYKNVNFSGITVNDFADFNNVKFNDVIDFDRATFNKDVSFNNTTFNKNAKFHRVTFNDGLGFTKSIFMDNAEFTSTFFGGATFFQAVDFHKNAVFNAIRSNGNFSLNKTNFKEELPDFIQANFKEAPRLDHIKIGDDVAPGSFKNSITTFIHPDIKARYQALKRLAIQAHDHENEQEYWARELRSDRSLRIEDGGWNLRPLVSAFWWGNIAYGCFSDYGRSIVRPLISLFILLCIMTNIHLLAHNSLNKEPTPTSKTKTHITKQSNLKDCDIRSSAFRVAAKNGAIGLLQNPAKRSTSARDYTCLYGTYNDNVTPKIPNSIFWIELLHTLFSAILIFLALLGIRNNFKLK